MGRHVPDSKIEHLARGGLTTHDSIRVQRHLFACGDCLRRLVAVEFRLAQEELLRDRSPVWDKRKPLFIVHDTADGLVYLRVEKRGWKWIARHWGDQLQGAREFNSMQGANKYAITAFSEMFPEHRCTDRCGIVQPYPATANP
jgi:hypothetical protein